MNTAAEKKNKFSCKITDGLISEYAVSVDGFSTLPAYNGVYWEAAVYFDKNDLTLNVLTERAEGIKEVEVFKIAINKIDQVNILEGSYDSLRNDFKVSVTVGAVTAILILLTLLLQPGPEHTDIGFITFFTLFMGIGMAAVIFAISFFFSPSPKNICINLITNDNRSITFFADTEQKELVIKMFSKHFRKLKDKGLPYWEINLN